MPSNQLSLRFINTFILFSILLLVFPACSSDDDAVVEEPRKEKVRKNAKDLTSEEKADYVNAILTLKATPSPYSNTLSYYDQFVRFHQLAVEKKICDTVGVAHANPAFPAWHRKLLILYEDALSEVSGKDIALPYWDWTDPASTAATFSEELMGGNGNPADEYAVTDGPFRKNVWQVNVFTVRPNYIVFNPHPWLVRNFGATILPESRGLPGYTVSLPTVGDINECLSITTYDMAPWDCSGAGNTSFRFCLEGFRFATCDTSQAMHNIGHDWIAGFFEIPVDTVRMITVESTIPPCGSVLSAAVPNNIRVGSMEPLDVSPNDPAFFMHHCNVDRIWDVWQQKPGNEREYQPVSGQAYGYNLTDDMYPYSEFPGKGGMDAHGITPQSMLSVKDLGYHYE